MSERIREYGSCKEGSKEKWISLILFSHLRSSILGQYMSQIEIEDLQIDFLITVQGYEYIILKMNLEAKKKSPGLLIKSAQIPRDWSPRSGPFEQIFLDALIQVFYRVLQWKPCPRRRVFISCSCRYQTGIRQNKIPLSY